MSGIGAEYIVLLAFLALFAGFTAAETLWLGRNGWGGHGKGVALSIISNVIGLFAGFVIFFIVTFAVLATAFNGISYTKFTSAEENTRLAIVIFSALFTPVLLIILKRLGLLVFGMKKGGAAWIFSIISTILFIVITIALPVAIGYFLFR